MKTALVIMAAGLGSRFGEGIKQLVPIDSYGHIIMDYSIFDAIEAGFNKIIIIIRKDIEEDFKVAIGNRIESICQKKGVEIVYCFQSLENVPGELPEGRTKPWGTGQAVLAAADDIDCPFAIINADDYYGKEAFVNIHDWLVNENNPYAISIAGFILKNTLSDNGGVTRGICSVDKDTLRVKSIDETRNIVKTPDGPEANGKKIDENSYVSMNMLGFASEGECKPMFIKTLTQRFEEFFVNEVPSNPLKAEYLIPILVGSLIQEGSYEVTAIPTNDRWFGVTYIEDREKVIGEFEKLISDNVYNPLEF